jgi:hypothetical protein
MRLREVLCAALGVAMKSLQCCECGAVRQTKATAKGNARLPAKWKRHHDRVYCPSCWRKHFVLRAVTFPVAGPVRRDWTELRAALTRCWEQSSSLANWAVTQLAKADVVRGPGDEKLPPMPHVYLYPEARRRYPDMPSKSIAALLHAVMHRYGKARLSVIWRAEASLQRFRFPVPFPVHNQGWDARYEGDNVPVIDVRLTDEQFTLRMRGGQQFRRQLAAFARIVSGEAVPGELSLYRQRVSDAAHRPGVEGGEPGGGARVHYRVMAKMVAWFPRAATSRARSGKLSVRTAPDAFLIAASKQRGPWVLNADHVRRWTALHRRRLDRLNDDAKHDKRWPKRLRRQMADHREALVERHRRRIHSFCHQAAAMLAAYANRLAVAEVRFDATDLSYLRDFRWSDFQQVLATKLGERGIRFVAVVGAPPDAQQTDKEAA